MDRSNRRHESANKSNVGFVAEDYYEKSRHKSRGHTKKKKRDRHRSLTPDVDLSPRKHRDKSDQERPRDETRHRHHQYEQSGYRELTSNISSKSELRDLAKRSKRPHSHRYHKHEKRHKQSSHVRKQSTETRRQLSRHRLRRRSSSESDIGETFIGEILRKTSSQNLKVENSKLPKPHAEVEKEPPKSFHDDQVSYTPPIHLLRMNSLPEPQKKSPDLPTEAAEKPIAKPRKKSVLELPMPPVIHQKVHKSVHDIPMPAIVESPPKPSTSSQESVGESISKAVMEDIHANMLDSQQKHKQCAKTPELKAEQFKGQQPQHFKEIQNHLTSNPAVISPDENSQEVQFPIQIIPKNKRPTVINPSRPSGVEYPDCDFNTFEIIDLVGEGTYGKVFKAMDLRTNNLVAMKFIRMDKESEGFPITGLREVKILRELQHPNVVQLREIVLQDDLKAKNPGTYLVFEYCNHDLMGLLDDKSMVFDEVSIYRIFKQLLEGINYCHQRNILHRDLKCSNILVNKDGTVKLADFGLGRQWITERPYTNMVISLWYRPIELLLGEEKYGTPVDIWSLGCILGELFQRRPVFPFSCETEMIPGIFNICGTPTKHTWPEVKYLAGYNVLKPKYCRRTLLEVFTHIIPPIALDLLDKMLTLNPMKRITAAEALKSNWMIVMGDRKFDKPLELPPKRDCHELDVKLRRKKRSNPF